MSRRRPKGVIPHIRCPNCHEKIDDYTVARGERQAIPEDGDVSVCASCGAVNVFDGGAVRRPTSEEMARFQQDPFIMNVARLTPRFLPHEGPTA